MRENIECLCFGSLCFSDKAAKGNLLGETVYAAPGDGHLGCGD